MAFTPGLRPNDIKSVVLREGAISVTILNLGCITQNWVVPSSNGPMSVVLGYRDPTAYRHNPGHLGAIIGRVANRIRQARFSQNGTTFQLAANEGPHMLHGGPGGLSTRLWQIERDGNRAVQLRLTSPKGDQGFPGHVEFTVTIVLAGNTLIYDMRAKVDRPTPINLAQHNYYNLSGQDDVRDHRLKLNAERYTPNDPDAIPTGEVLTVQNTRFDFTGGCRLADADPLGLGYDINYVLCGTQPAATLQARNQMALRLETDQPGLQLYTSQHLRPSHDPLQCQNHRPFGAVCLEPQGFPNAINTSTFPNTLVTPDAPYRQVLRVTIAQDTS